MTLTADTHVVASRSQSRFWVEPARRMSWQRFTSHSRIAYPEHVHSEFNIVVCLAGSIEVRQYGHSECAGPGEALIGNAVIPHQSVYSPEAGLCEAVSLTVSSELFHEAAASEADWGTPAGRLSVYLGKLASGRIHSIAREVYEELAGRGSTDQKRLEGLGRLLLGATVRQWPKQGRCQESQLGEAVCLPRWQFVQTHEHMLKSRKDEFAVNKMAKKLGICTSRFHHLFRASAGLPPAQYFQELLLQQAMDRLTGTREPIKQISYEIGFRTPSHFCSVFRKHYGISPLAFRAKEMRDV